MQGGSAYASEQGLDNAGMLTQGIGGPNVGGPIVSHGCGPNVGGPIVSHGCGPNVGGPIVSHGCGPNVDGPNVWSHCVPRVWSQWWEQCMGEGRASEPGLVTSQWT